MPETRQRIALLRSTLEHQARSGLHAIGLPSARASFLRITALAVLALLGINLVLLIFVDWYFVSEDFFDLFLIPTAMVLALACGVNAYLVTLAQSQAHRALPFGVTTAPVASVVFLERLIRIIAALLAVAIALLPSAWYVAAAGTGGDRSLETAVLAVAVSLGVFLAGAIDAILVWLVPGATSLQLRMPLVMLLGMGFGLSVIGVALVPDVAEELRWLLLPESIASVIDGAGYPGAFWVPAALFALGISCGAVALRRQSKAVSGGAFQRFDRSGRLRRRTFDTLLVQELIYALRSPVLKANVLAALVVMTVLALVLANLGESLFAVVSAFVLPLAAVLVGIVVLLPRLVIDRQMPYPTLLPIDRRKWSLRQVALACACGFGATAPLLILLLSSQGRHWLISLLPTALIAALCALTVSFAAPLQNDHLSQLAGLLIMSALTGALVFLSDQFISFTGLVVVIGGALAVAVSTWIDSKRQRMA